VAYSNLKCSITPSKFRALIAHTGNLWYSAVWRGALSAVVVGGFSDSSWTGAHTPGRGKRWRGEENQVTRDSYNTTVIAGLS